MCDELRALHDRLHATTVYVTHDQLEAMAMADTIALMNDGVVEQVGSPQEIYDRPKSMFAAGFIGSPPLNFIPFRGRLLPGDKCVHAGEAAIEIPEAREGTPEADLMLGARPEHVRLSASAPLRASVVEAEYLGTNQIVTLVTSQGTLVKARVPSEVRARPGETTGLEFRSGKLSLFHRASGRVLRSALHERVAHG